MDLGVDIWKVSQARIFARPYRDVNSEEKVIIVEGAELAQIKELVQTLTNINEEVENLIFKERKYCAQLLNQKIEKDGSKPDIENYHWINHGTDSAATS
ncbi:hypothetical protein K3495_g12346 [Podosphaera aphanis]|nr:hypothetical protein K3495_g12346 [Podosphaera aphanis]